MSNLQAAGEFYMLYYCVVIYVVNCDFEELLGKYAVNIAIFIKCYTNKIMITKLCAARALPINQVISNYRYYNQISTF